MPRKPAPAPTPQPQPPAPATPERPRYAPGLEALLVPVESLALDELNARSHDERNLAAIRASLSRFGQQKPIVVDSAGVVLAGNGTLVAARALGWTQIACVRTHLAGEDARAYALADNRSAELAGWNLAALLRDLDKLPDSIVADLGWSPDEVRAMHFDLTQLQGTGGKDLNREIDPPAAPTSRRGELWGLGRHRLLCGDSTSREDVARLLRGGKPMLMVTDPPYGVSYDPAWRKQVGLAPKVAEGRVMNDDRADWRAAWDLFPGAVAYVWHGGLHAPTVAESLRASGFDVRAQIVWVKPRAAISRGAYHWQHEPAMVAQRAEPSDEEGAEHELAAYAVRRSSTALWAGGRKQSTVWFIEHLKNATGHGTQKPFECMARPMRNHGRPGDLVYDPFVGSGTTICAAEILGRTALAMELDPAYVDVCRQRFEELTGVKPVLLEPAPEKPA